MSSAISNKSLTKQETQKKIYFVLFTRTVEMVLDLEGLKKSIQLLK